MLSALSKLKVVGVMGSGRKKWPEYAEPLGMELAKRNVHLLTGGGDGVMKSVARGFTSVEEKRGLSIGCIPMKRNDTDVLQAPHQYPNRYVEIAVYTPLGVYEEERPNEITRNHINILSSDIVIALPGLGGTRNEIDLSQQFNKALLLYGPEEEFADLPSGLSRAPDLQSALIWLDQQLSFN